MAASPLSSRRKHEFERRQMQAAVGKALTAWANIEGNLCFLFQTAMAAKDPTVATAVFTTINGFEIRLAITRAAMKVAYKKSPRVLAHWKTIATELGEILRKKRNKLAHGVILHPYSSAKKSAPDFVPYWHSMHPRKLPDFEHWTIEDIERAERDFTRVGGELWQLALALFDQTWSPSSGPKPSPVRRRIPRKKSRSR